MNINLHESDLKEISERTKSDPRVMAALFNAELYNKVFSEKKEQYLKEIKSDYRNRIACSKKWDEYAYTAKNGKKVRSITEKRILDFLINKKLKVEYEAVVKIAGYSITTDFFLPDYWVFIEHFGVDSEEYKKTAEKKKVRYENMKFIYTEKKDEPNIEKVIARKLSEVGVFT